MTRELYCDGGEIAYEIEWWIDVAHDQQEPIVVELEKADIGNGTMWCSTEKEFVERGCSKDCDSYAPCNGVSGRCRLMKNSLTGTGIKYTVYPDGRVEKCT